MMMILLVGSVEMTDVEEGSLSLLLRSCTFNFVFVTVGIQKHNVI